MSEYKSNAQVVAELVREPYKPITSSLVLRDCNYASVDIEKQLPSRTRVRGCFSTNEIASFKQYIDSKNPETPVFIDSDTMYAKAIFNYGDNETQGHCDDTAVLALKKTPLWSELTERNGSKLSQKGFIEFFEGWGHLLHAHGSDDEPIERGQAIAAVRSLTIDTAKNISNTVTNHSESRSKFENIETKATQGKLPTYFEITNSCYNDLPARSVKVRLVVHTADDKPCFSLRIDAIDLIKYERAAAFSDALYGTLTTQHIYRGTYSS